MNTILTHIIPKKNPSLYFHFLEIKVLTTICKKLMRD